MEKIDTPTMSEKDRLIEVASKLVKKTNRGELHWDEYDPNELENIAPPDEAGKAYRTMYNGRELRIYKYRERHETPEAMRMDPEAPDFTWTDETILKLKNPETNGEWTFPELSILDDLHASAKLESAGVQEWVRSVLDEDQ